MKPVDFLASNLTLAENQEEYTTLPAWLSPDSEEVVTCWKLSLWERLKLLWTGELWLRQLVFKQTFQPQLPQVEVPPNMLDDVTLQLENRDA